MVGLFHAQGAAESNAAIRLWVRSHVPGTRRDRAQAEEGAIQGGELETGGNRGQLRMALP